MFLNSPEMTNTQRHCAGQVFRRCASSCCDFRGHHRRSRFVATQPHQKQIRDMSWLSWRQTSKDNQDCWGMRVLEEGVKTLSVWDLCFQGSCTNVPFQVCVNLSKWGVLWPSWTCRQMPSCTTTVWVWDGLRFVRFALVPRSSKISEKIEVWIGTTTNAATTATPPTASRCIGWESWKEWEAESWNRKSFDKFWLEFQRFHSVLSCLRVWDVDSVKVSSFHLKLRLQQLALKPHCAFRSWFMVIEGRTKPQKVKLQYQSCI